MFKAFFYVHKENIRCRDYWKDNLNITDYVAIYK